jgi:hypothetical protein
MRLRIKKSKLAALIAALLSIALCVGMSYAWFVSSLPQVEVNVKTAVVKITNFETEFNASFDSNWARKTDPDPMSPGYYPGEIVMEENILKLQNASTREVLIQFKLSGFRGYRNTTEVTDTDADHAYSILQAIRQQVLGNIATGLGLGNTQVEDAQKDPVTINSTSKTLYWDASTLTDPAIYLFVPAPTSATPEILGTDIPLGFVIPDALGGMLSSSYGTGETKSKGYVENLTNNSLDNITNPFGFNESTSTLYEQLSRYTYKIDISAVQGTIAAVTDRFGTTIANKFSDLTNY